MSRKFIEHTGLYVEIPFSGMVFLYNGLTPKPYKVFWMHDVSSDFIDLVNLNYHVNIISFLAIRQKNSV